MVVESAVHKAFIHYLFHTDVNGRLHEKTFPLDRLVDAAGLLRKLRDDIVDVVDDDGNPVARSFVGAPLDLSVGESIIARDLIKEVREGTPSELEIILELKELFK